MTADVEAVTTNVQRMTTNVQGMTAIAGGMTTISDRSSEAPIGNAHNHRRVSLGLDSLEVVLRPSYLFSSQYNVCYVGLFGFGLRTRDGSVHRSFVHL